MIELDGAGVYGSVLGFSMTVAYVGSAFIIFLYLFSKGNLSLDEEAARNMMKEQGDEER